METAVKKVGTVTMQRKVFPSHGYAVVALFSMQGGGVLFNAMSNRRLEGDWLEKDRGRKSTQTRMQVVQARDGGLAAGGRYPETVPVVRQCEGPTKGASQPCIPNQIEALLGFRGEGAVYGYWREPASINTIHDSGAGPCGLLSLHMYRVATNS
ncbi:hypothetical protein B0H13DRAFT_1871915 [Mycena leptocephala]|nr:hypothetical protein B0H13DRAFT_1871915 [Mycena leptocephala]